MKKLLLLAGLLSIMAVNAQDIALTHDGIPFVDGEVFTFNSTNNEIAKISILATNNTDEPIFLQIRVDEVSNNPNGEGVALCFVSVCFNDIQVGDLVPPTIQNIPIEAGQSNPIADHFFSTYPGDGINPVEYSFTFIQTDADGNVLNNDILSFGFKYEPTAGIDNFEALKNMGIVLNNTVVNNTLNIDATVNATIQLFDINGKLVKSVNVENGSQAIDLSELNSAIYIAKFVTSDNRSTTVRIVKN